MLRVLLVVLAALVVFVPACASALPICTPGTMADYLALGSVGCQIDVFRLSNFTYGDGGARVGFLLGPTPPTLISLQPSDISVGIAVSPPHVLHINFAPPVVEGTQALWLSVGVGFDAEAPSILGLSAFVGLQSIANLQVADFIAGVDPGGSIAFLQGYPCFFLPPGEPPPDACNPPGHISFSPIDFGHIGAGGIYVYDFGLALDSAAPEPATLLLFGTTVAGLGLARWRRRRSDRLLGHLPRNER